jgi:hypothetical protein
MKQSVQVIPSSKLLECYTPNSGPPSNLDLSVDKTDSTANLEMIEKTM